MPEIEFDDGKEFEETLWADNCPYCQSKRIELEARDIPSWRTQRVYVFCVECMARGPEAETFRGAIQAWNTHGPGFDLQGELQRTLNLLRTGLAPNSFNMSYEQWVEHKIGKASAEIQWIVKKINDRSDK